ncbi:cytochrome c oxidase assembly protein [Roseomonas vastitatis]|uniref:Cytochrome c oxidase assembly protein n=2 Tax=Teichococcus vastitatis TaxID=2307076 RepID=A0ABS9W6I6_9PROT|nr:cytochrome c oxidase assembly protein [Pseudoroseomonas vastitatis]MCI0754904.1 cytochrome c oxidase assembly protein [Pseudoroseomonas vastitatis]
MAHLRPRTARGRRSNRRWYSTIASPTGSQQCSATGQLGALLTFAPRVLYGVQTAQAGLWGLTPLEDQQLAGLVMWIPAGTVYAGAALPFFAAWLRRPGQAWRADNALPP